ncbi:hypothetical protein [Vibrio vulnificus]|uniref:hypothetical protein n=1 Tax=Vibrio vulnificus TaxID=672 RepID=UPI00188A204D|nr:hypothetical protein [Vibrio vulnificus]MBF4498973.1 hypothetical protein [Vibrio vulnificus]
MMEKVLIEIDDMTSELRELVDDFKTYIGDKPISKQVRDGFSSFYEHLGTYSKVSQEDDIDKLTSSAKAIAVYGQVIGQGVAKLQDADNQMKSLGSEILTLSNKFRNVIENSPLEYQALNFDSDLSKNHEVNSFKSVKTNLKKLSDSHLEHDQRIKKLLGENDVRISELSERVKKIDNAASSEIEKVIALYNQSLKEVESKKKQIDEILGHVSGRAISGDYETSAAEEKKMANWLRYASLGCMFAIVLVVAYSFWETTTNDFQWQNSIFRIVLAVMLSVPAAYLARESAKHREQQYSHLQTSLDLKAISPYISSLPESDQHKIKVEVAGRLFAAKDFSNVGAEPYPINVHEIVMELIKKVEVNKNSDSNSKRKSG